MGPSQISHTHLVGGGGECPASKIILHKGYFHYLSKNMYPSISGVQWEVEGGGGGAMCI